MNRELVECRRNAGREAPTAVCVEFPRALFHFALSPFAEWKLSTSHPSNPRLHASASNFIHHNYAARCPLSSGYLHRDLALFHSSESTYTDYVLAGNVRRSIALLMGDRIEATIARFRINGLDPRGE